ncbi:UBA/TS-N domain containing protein [Entamoeba histolytica HM-1:IMSS-A]|uniref:UBA/TS-N domain containing protein n=1 Tax=Entamoeba histolytica HM-1:IMSS-A TaxID=885318 RepID=N9UT91_ENTH1|nr:UBA/TS-N domain containing protein [Entamoeba histolytica HM-1:IMSS-A]
MNKIGFSLFVQVFNGTSDELKQVINQFNPDIGIIHIEQIRNYKFKVTVQNTEQGRMLMNFNDFLWNGSKMVVTFEREPPREQQYKFVLEQIKYKYCNIKTRSLDLSFFINKLKEFEYRSTQSFDILLKDALNYYYQDIPDLLSLNLSNNNINWTTFFDEMCHGFKELTLLDLSNNKITNYMCLGCLKNIPLRNLCLLGNPLPPVDSLFLIHTFPFLEIFNNKLFERYNFNCTIKSNVNTLQYNTIHPLNLNKFESIYNFFDTYFKFQDNNIESLSQLYSTYSYFDITLGKGVQLVGVNSRNIINLNAIDTKRFIQSGTNQIINGLKTLGKTKHRISDMCFDIVEQGVFYIINIMGQCEIRQNTLQFCRTFIVNTENQQLIIVNDHLHLYNNSNKFIVIKTFSKFLKHIVHSFPGIKEKQALIVLEKNNWDMKKTESEICNLLHIQPLTMKQLNPMNNLEGIEENDIEHLNEENISKLVELGFLRETAIRALILSDGNLELAAERLTQQQDSFVLEENNDVWNQQDEENIQRLIALVPNREVCISAYLQNHKNCERAADSLFQ